jgi:hypothetical protein
MTLTSLFVLFALSLSVFAQQAQQTSTQPKQQGEQRTFTGTWTCLACDLKGLEGSAAAECEQLGHKHSLRLSNGKYIYFIENERSADLLKGGRVHNVKITVKGTYYPNAHAIDVESYIIDGKKTAWCTQHQRMDMDASTVGKQASEETGK